MNNILLSLSDGDKRLIFSLILIIVVVLAFIGLLGYFLFRIMRWQSKKIDSLVHDAVVTKVVTNRRHLLNYGRKKNWGYFFKQAYIPVLILILAFVILIIHNSIYGDWGYNPFNSVDGFGTLFFTWKFTGNTVGGGLIRFAELALDNTPHFVASAWAGYIFCPLFLIGGTWYFISASCLLSRTIMLYKRSRTVFEKSLEGYRQDETFTPKDNNGENN